VLEMLLAPRRSLGLALLLYSFVADTLTQERGSKKGYLLFFLYFSSGSTYLSNIRDLDLHHRIDILSTSTQTPKQRSEGWVRTSMALARGTRLRLESTSQPSAGEGWGLRSNSACVLSTRVYRRTRRQTNGRGWQRTSQTLTAFNISDLGGAATSRGKAATPQITGTLEALDHSG
jgi:hypothetical protein